MLESKKRSVETPLKTGLFVDGFTMRKVNEYYRNIHPEYSGINFLGLKHWVAVQVSRYFWPGRSIEMMAHYYHPYRNPEEDRDYRHRGMMHFSDELHKAGFEVHFAGINYANDLCPNLELKEDVMLYARYHQLDALVLVSTQGQYASLPQMLSTMGIQTLLLGWNFVYHNRDREVHWHTDQDLKRLSTYYVPMELIMKKASTDVLAQELFLSPKAKFKACRGVSSGFPRGTSRLPFRQ
ncbi:MAG: NYN domain-containing protein [Fibrobacter sp.]|nr:NYN domain-containing protein [Fibrobacter sp.]